MSGVPPPILGNYLPLPAHPQEEARRSFLSNYLDQLSRKIENNSLLNSLCEATKSNPPPLSENDKKLEVRFKPNKIIMCLVFFSYC